MADDAAELDRIERFLSAFNAIEGRLRQSLDAGNGVGFRELSRRYAHRHRWWKREDDAMEPLAEMRNFLVHRRVEPHVYAAVPRREVVELIESIRDRLTKPRTVHDAFAREVITVAPRSTLAEVLRVIGEAEITHFPVVDGGRFVGLLTTDGIARWLARNVHEISPADLEGVAVEDVLAAEEPRESVAFVPRSTPVDDAIDLFGTNPRLRAILVTETGRASEAPLGIITTSDAAQVAGT
jgi:CBS domain-containing protein